MFNFLLINIHKLQGSCSKPSHNTILCTLNLTSEHRKSLSGANGTPDADQMIDQYTKMRGVGKDFNLSVYTVYMFYKSCCILQGVYKRFIIGKLSFLNGHSESLMDISHTFYSYHLGYIISYFGPDSLITLTRNMWCLHGVSEWNWLLTYEMVGQNLDCSIECCLSMWYQLLDQEQIVNCIGLSISQHRNRCTLGKFTFISNQILLILKICEGSMYTRIYCTPLDIDSHYIL